jgi:hypothetical protein
VIDARLLLRKILEMAGGTADRGYVLAYDLPAVTWPEKLDGTHAILRPQTELAIRRAIVRSQGGPFIALVSEKLGRNLPADVVRGARGGRVFPLELGTMLALVLGIPISATDDEELLQLAFDNVEALQHRLSTTTRPTVIDRRLLDELLLDVCLGDRVRKTRPAELLAEWIRKAPQLTPPVARLLRQALPTLHAVEGRMLAWTLGAPERAVDLVVRGALLDLDGGQVPAAWGPLHSEEAQKELGVTDEVILKTLVPLAQDTLDLLGPDAEPLLLSAETQARPLFPPNVLARSAVLPLGVEVRCSALAQKAAKGESIPPSEIAWLRDHRAAGRFQKEIDVLEAVGRLTRWLGDPLPPVAGVSEMIRRYQRSSAFADVAASHLVRALAATASFHSEAQAVLGRYRARRDEENLAFASELAKGYVKSLYAKGVVALPDVWKDIVLRDEIARDRAGGKGGLFLAVLDGCSYPVFLELLLDLQQAIPRVGLSSAGFEDVARGIPALAPLPTITGHARGALFLGEIPNDPWIPEAAARDLDAKTDHARFARNAALGARARKLFLKGDLADGAAALREELKGPTAIVAAVFNAVDDQIGSANTGARLRVRPEDIGGFLPGLKAAFEAGRRVLVTADHGHTPFWGKEACLGMGAPPRFCELVGGGSPPDGFVELALGELGGTKGRKAFAWKTGVYHGTPQVGFHGGCSLEEMVVPLAWLVADGVPADDPTWWYGTPPPVEPVGTGALPGPSKPAARVPTRTRVAAVQSDLFDPVSNLAAGIAVVALSEHLATSLDASERAALVLLAQNREVRGADLAARIGKGSRISGFMTQLHRKLHAAGAARFQHRDLPDGERLYVYGAPETP